MLEETTHKLNEDLRKLLMIFWAFAKHVRKSKVKNVEKLSATIKK